jgi:Right handed beta helix region
MTKMALVAGALFSLCLAALPVAAQSTADHTYVSGKGTDSGGCTYPAVACRGFTYALAQTSPSGEIFVLDPADYGSVTITKSISIVADAGGPAGIIVPTGSAITINAGANTIVNLRGLTLDGEGTATDGISITSAGSVTISDSVFRNFQDSGILILPGSIDVSVLNSVMTNNGSSPTYGNGGGIDVVGAGLNQTFLTVRKSVANNNRNGFSVFKSTVTFADTMATGNTQAGISLTSDCACTVFSYGDNEINGNGTNVLGGTLTPLTKQ